MHVPADRGGSCFHAELLVYPLQVFVHSARADSQDEGDVAVGLAAGEPLEDLALECSEWALRGARLNWAAGIMSLIRRVMARGLRPCSRTSGCEWKWRSKAAISRGEIDAGRSLTTLRRPLSRSHAESVTSSLATRRFRLATPWRTKAARLTAASPIAPRLSSTAR